MGLAEMTDGKLAHLETEIRDIYREAWEGLHIEEAAFFDDLRRRDEEMRSAIESGEYPVPSDYTPEQYYRQWRLNQIGRDARWKALRERIAQRMVEADKVAASYVNDTTPGVYSLNANYTSYTIEQAFRSKDMGNGAKAGVAFDIVDEQTIKRLSTQGVQMFPQLTVKEAKNNKWNNDAVQRKLVSGILQGKSIMEIAKSFREISQMDERFAIKAARTAVTGAQNAGRVASYEQAEKLGIELDKQWVATLDDRTRSSHQQLDGVRVKPKEKFEGHGLERPLEYPGDSSGAPCDVWNCRCTLIAVIPGLNDDRSKFARRAAYMETDPDDPDRRYKTYDVLKGYTYRGEAGTKSFEKWLEEKIGVSEEDTRIIEKTPIVKIEKKKKKKKVETAEHETKPKTIENDSKKDTAKSDFTNAPNDGILSVTTIDGIKVTRESLHADDRKAERAVSNDGIVDALEHPLHVEDRGEDAKGRKSLRYIGANATVNVNPDTGVITTVWKTGSTVKRKMERDGNRGKKV